MDPLPDPSQQWNLSTIQHILIQQQQTIRDQQIQIDDLSKAVDHGWIYVSAYLVFIMQLGFALLEAGSVRAMNTKNIIMQNILDTGISIIMFWLIGYGITQGNSNMVIGDMKSSATNATVSFASFLFLWAYDNAATTIVSGSVTSRIKFSGYMASCVVLSGFTFPMMVYWTWGRGFLGTEHPDGLAVIDFAGGTVVHVVGGVSGLAGAIWLGPRIGRFVRDETTGKMIDNKERGHSVVLTTVGVFLLWFGWFGFNPGATMGLTRGRYLVAGNCAVASLCAAGSAAVSMTLYVIYVDGVHDLWELLNGILCGLVAVTPACATVDPWGAVLIGATSILPYRWSSKLMVKLGIDDVVDAFSLHGVCGSYGTICAGLLSTQDNLDAAYGVGRFQYNRGKQLGIQLLAVLISSVFAFTVQSILFLGIKHTFGIRVSASDEKVGLDFKYHAGYAYPDFNQKVKRAHEQIELEHEIALQVRREMNRGRSNRFKEALTELPRELPSGTPIDPPRRHRRTEDEHEMGIGREEVGGSRDRDPEASSSSNNPSVSLDPHMSSHPDTTSTSARTSLASARPFLSHKYGGHVANVKAMVVQAYAAASADQDRDLVFNPVLSPPPLSQFDASCHHTISSDSFTIHLEHSPPDASRTDDLTLGMDVDDIKLPPVVEPFRYHETTPS